MYFYQKREFSSDCYLRSSGDNVDEIILSSGGLIFWNDLTKHQRHLGRFEIFARFYILYLLIDKAVLKSIVCEAEPRIFALTFFSASEQYCFYRGALSRNAFQQLCFSVSGSGSIPHLTYCISSNFHCIRSTLDVKLMATLTPNQFFSLVFKLVNDFLSRSLLA